MRYISPIPAMKLSEIVIGCMRIAKMSQAEVAALIMSGQEAGINFYDHADVYGGGDSEAIFGQALKTLPLRREDLYIQSKCGITRSKDIKFFDYSKAHILLSVEGSLKRLQTDYLDVLLLHRPDALVEPEEVAEAFQLLKQQGKVLHFGVSNHTPYQIDLLRQAVKEELRFNQLQMSLMFTGMVDAGLNQNMKNPHSVDHDRGILDYSRIKRMTVQAWSPFQYGFFEGVFVGNDKFPELNKTLTEMAAKYAVSPSAIAVAWLLRHPVSMQVVLGTTRPDRVRDIAPGADITLSREDWYKLYTAAGNTLP